MFEPATHLRTVVIAAAVAATLLGVSQAKATEAVCRDYVQAQGPNTALFVGFLYGYTASRMLGRSDQDINAATLRLAALVGEHCSRQPNERVLAAVEVLVPLALQARVP